MQKCVQNTEYFNVEVEGTYSNHSNLKNYCPKSIFLHTSHAFDVFRFNSIHRISVIQVTASDSCDYFDVNDSICVNCMVQSAA